MNNNLFQTPSKNIKLFFVIMFVGFSFACCYHSILDLFGMPWPWNTFLFNPEDRFNDWYNSVAQAASINPYYSSNHALAAYFPVTYILLKVAVGYSSVTSISIYFAISIGLLVLSALLLRTQFLLNSFDYSVQSIKDSVLLVFSCLISYPVLFALDRGNIDIWIALLCVLFIVTQSTRLEVVGLICLSLAISMKGYPASFLLLLVLDRKYRSLIFCIFSVIMMTGLTLYFMWYGFDQNLNGFINNLNSYYRDYVVGGASLFASSDPYNAVRLIIIGIIKIWRKLILPNNVPLSLEAVSESILKIYSLLSLSFAAIATFFVLAIHAKRWKKVTVICLIALIFPNVANDYKLCFLFPGLYLLLTENKFSRSEKNSFALLCILMIPKSYIFIQGKPISMLINPMLLIALAYQVMGDRQSWLKGIQLLKSRAKSYFRV